MAVGGDDALDAGDAGDRQAVIARVAVAAGKVGWSGGKVGDDQVACVGVAVGAAVPSGGREWDEAARLDILSGWDG